MNELANFFKRTHTTIDRPSHHLVAVFPTVEIAQQAAAALRMAGFPSEDVVAAGGDDLIKLEAEETGVASFLLKALSRFFATEQKYVDHDLALTREGAGFLAVHCTTEQMKNDAWKIIDSQGPLDARYYATGGIEHLAGDLRTD